VPNDSALRRKKIGGQLCVRRIGFSGFEAGEAAGEGGRESPKSRVGTATMVPHPMRRNALGAARAASRRSENYQIDCHFQ